MSTVRIWVLESEYDEKVVECLAKKLTIHLQLNNLSIKISGKRALASIQRNKKHKKPLKEGIRNFLKEDDCVIFILDLDSPQSLSAKRAQANSLINQVEELVNEPMVFFAPAIWEIEAWLLIDCLGIVCYFASSRKQFKKDCRQKVSTRTKFNQLIKRYQKGDMRMIVEAEQGGNNAKECLQTFSEETLLALNPKMPRKNVRKNRYKENMSPVIAEHIEINTTTVGRSNSLRYLGQVLAQFN